MHAVTCLGIGLALPFRSQAEILTIYDFGHKHVNVGVSTCLSAPHMPRMCCMHAEGLINNASMADLPLSPGMPRAPPLEQLRTQVTDIWDWAKHALPDYATHVLLAWVRSAHAERKVIGILRLSAE